MNIIDSIAGYISPRWGALRAEWRNTLEAYRGNYDAGADGRLQSQWNIQNLSGEMTDRYDRDRVRARARDLERNSDTMNSVVRHSPQCDWERHPHTGDNRGCGYQRNTGENVEKVVQTV